MLAHVSRFHLYHSAIYHFYRYGDWRRAFSTIHWIRPRVSISCWTVTSCTTIRCVWKLTTSKRVQAITFSCWSSIGCAVWSLAFSSIYRWVQTRNECEVYSTNSYSNTLSSCWWIRWFCQCCTFGVSWIKMSSLISGLVRDSKQCTCHGCC